MAVKGSVVIADRSPLAVASLKAFLERRTGLRVVGIAHEAEEAFYLCRYFQPDVLITDLKIESDLDGLYVIKQVRETSKDTLIIVLSSRQSERDMVSSRSAGAAAHLTKGCDPTLIVKAIDAFKK